MSHPFKKAACILAGLAIVVCAAGTASAAKPIVGSKPQPAKPALSVKQKNDLAAAMARKGKQKPVPKTMAEAEASMYTSGGITFIEVPEEVYNYLAATPDAQGRMHVRDTGSTGPSHAAAVEAANEN